MSKVQGLKAFLAALCLSAVAVDEASAQDASGSPQVSQGEATESTATPNWLLRGRGQNGIVNPFRATPAPGAGDVRQLRAPELKSASPRRDAPTGVAPTVPGQPPSCLIGFRRQGSQCVAIRIPEHGTLDLSGHGWTCERGYRLEGQSCVAWVVPENAALNAAGNAWVCNSGFRRQGQGCAAIVVPANASLDKTGHAWACNQGYVQRGPTCIDEGTARLQQQADQAVKARPSIAPAAPERSITVNSGENRQGRTSKAKVVIGRF